MLTLEQRRQEMLTYAAYYNLRIFVESGTNDGDTVNALLDSGQFDELFTIEIDPALWALAQQRFVADLNVHCLNGDSGEVLPQIVTQLAHPTLFWLDGHFCGGDFKPEIDTPIVAEVTAVLISAPTGSVVLIDDARLFGGGEEHTEEFKDYPTIAWVENMAEVYGFHFELRDDLMRLTSTPVG